MRTTATIAALSLVGCLPPPRAWLDDSSASTLVDSEETEPAEETDVDDSDPPSEDDPPEDSGQSEDGGSDTAEEATALACHSIAFEDGGFVEITAAQLGLGHLLDSNSLTVELWAWFFDRTRSGSWLLAGVEGNRAWRLAIETDQVVLRAGMYSVSMPIPADGWQHLAGVVDGDVGEMALYLNGERQVVGEWEPAMESTLPDPSLRLGSWHEAGGSWPSSMDEFRFSTTVMHGSAAFVPRVDRPADGWSGVWRFNEDLYNEASGRVAFGEGIRFTNACP